MKVRLSLPSIDGFDLPITRLDATEELGVVSSFEVLVSDSVAAGSVVGESAVLTVGARSLMLVVSSASTGELGHTLTLVPRAWLLSLSKRSRSFERVTVLEVARQILTTSDVELSLAASLSAETPHRASIVQHRETDLDFLLRVLEREGITVSFEDDAALRLSDVNAGLALRGALTPTSLESKSRLLPKRVLVFGSDPSRPNLPLTATAVVSTRGVGEVEVHDELFTAPEEGAAAAALAAERLLCGGAILEGSCAEPIMPGRWDHAGSPVIVHRVAHTWDGATWSSRFTAIPASVRFRPQRRIPEPKVFGLTTGRVAPATEVPHSGELRVRERAGHTAERGIPLPPGADMMSEGTRVVWGCLDGDPERPVLTGVEAQAGSATERVVMRSATGATLELAGSMANPPDRSLGTLAPNGIAPSVEHHAAQISPKETYARLAVPHSTGWSYFRLGDIGDEITLPAGFNEETKYKAIQRTGYAEDLGNSWTDNATGIFDYTDNARTQLTKGDWEHVVDGTGRLAIAGGNDRDLTNYELIVGKKLAFQQVRAPQWNYATGAKVDYFGGLKVDTVIGGKADVLLGGKAGVDVGFMIGITAGYKLDFVFADSFEIRKGEELGLSTTMDKRAKNLIQFSIEESGASDSIDKGTYIAAAVAAIGAAAAITAGEVAKSYTDEDRYSTGATAALGLIYAITFGVMRAKSKERDLTDGDPILSLDKPNKFAALRSDDWLFQLAQSHAVLGKNKPYTAEKSVSALTIADAGTAIIIEENEKLTLQSDKAKAASVVLDKDKIIIKAKDITIEATGTLTLVAPNTKIDGKLEVTGETTMAKKLMVGATAVNP